MDKNGADSVAHDVRERCEVRDAMASRGRTRKGFRKRSPDRSPAFRQRTISARTVSTRTRTPGSVSMALVVAISWVVVRKRVYGVGTGRPNMRRRSRCGGSQGWVCGTYSARRGGPWNACSTKCDHLHADTISTRTPSPPDTISTASPLDSPTTITSPRDRKRVETLLLRSEKLLQSGSPTPPSDDLSEPSWFNPKPKSDEQELMKEELKQLILEQLKPELKQETISTRTPSPWSWVCSRAVWF